MKTMVRTLIAVVIILIIAVLGYKIYTAHTANVLNKAIIKEYGNLYGYVNKVDNEIFTVSKQKVIKQGNRTMNQDTGQTIKFKCNKDTKVIKRTIYSINKSKAEAKDQAGSLSDIKVDKLVSVWGKSQADGTITAETVVLMEFN